MAPQRGRADDENTIHLHLRTIDENRFADGFIKTGASTCHLQAVAVPRSPHLANEDLKTAMNVADHL